MTLAMATLLAVLGAAPIPGALPEGLVVGERLSDGRGVVVLHALDGRQQWYTLPTSFEPRDVLPGIQAAKPEVDELLASPDGRWLAVVSSEDGHPQLEIIDLPMLLAGRGWTVIASLDPFPGSLRVAGWLESELVVKSEWPLLRCRADCAGAGGPDPGGEQAFVMEPQKHTLRATTAADLDRDRERRLELDDED